MKRSEIRARMAAAIDDEDNIFVTTTEANRSIDEAVEIICERTKSLRRTAYVSLREGANFYWCNSIADDMMYPYRLWNEQINQRLDAGSIEELDTLAITWLSTSGTPRVWFPISWDFFGVYPHPASSGGVLRVDYIAWPRALMDDDDEPELPESTHDAVCYYGAYEGQLKEWDMQSAATMYQLFQQATGDAKGLTTVGRVQAREWGRSGLNLPTGIQRR